MSTIVARSCTEIREGHAQRSDSRASRPLDSFRDTSAYVLLGDPGAGKSESFATECAAHGSQACLVTARDFLTFGMSEHPEWREKVLFIDGLDEVRAGAGDVRKPFDAIRRQLDKLGKPRFRLSCREADWLGANDEANLTSVSRDSRVTVLHLDPLTDHDIEQILNAHSGVNDAREFMMLAREKGVDGLLRNPQCLNMLAEVVGDGRGWPANRLDLFEAACRKLVGEHNEEHLAAAQSLMELHVPTNGLTEEALLDAAGRLCAVQLIAGIAGFASAPTGTDRDYALVAECAGMGDVTGGHGHDARSRVHELRRTLTTKLFSVRASGRFGPLHRHVAEFLGARYLARLIGGDVADRQAGRSGLPYGRVTSLLTGYDGIVVTELRGLSAWIAAQSRSVRGDLIERDPIGVGLYGDIYRFSVAEKHALMESLKVQAYRLVSISHSPGSFSALTGAGMEPAIGEILTDPCRSDDHEKFTYFVLRIAAKGASMPELSGILLDTVRDKTRSPGINRAALDALICSYSDERQTTATLRELLVDLRSGRISDPDDELLGTVLTHLYPHELPPAEVWDYFALPSNRELFGAHRAFWRYVLAAECSDVEVAEHLDTLAARIEDLRSVLEDRAWCELPLELLLRALETHGSRISTNRLYDWLGVGLPAMELGYPKTSDATGRIRAWLEQHPRIQRAVFAEGVRRTAVTGNDEWLVVLQKVLRHLYDSKPPPGFGVWCLNQAMASTDTCTAGMYLERSLAALANRTGDEGLSLDALLERTRARPDLVDVVEKLSVSPLDTGYLEHLKRVRGRTPRAENLEREHQEWIEHVRAQEAPLRANRGSPSLLHGFALAYLGIATDAAGDDPLERLSSCFRNDRHLVEVALSALQQTIHRDDLPDIAQIIRLDSRKKLHYLALPILAGLAEMDRTEPESVANLNDRQVRIALAVRYYHASDRESHWYQQLVATEPDVVAGVLAECAASRIRRAGSPVMDVYALAHDDGHAAVARVACVPLLRLFPIRCTVKQLDSLGDLLWAAILHADRHTLQALIEEKLARSSMNNAQRAGWLMCGVIAAPDSYEQPLWDFARGRERRIRHIAGFWRLDVPARFPFGILSTSALKLLVSLLGSWCGPGDRFATGWVTPAMEASRGVGSFIGELASRSSTEAGVALEALASDSTLASWRPELIQARDAQRVIRRDAAYRHPDIEQVCRTLHDGPPANAADLWVLLVDRLEEIAGRIRQGNTDDWRQYWNEDSHGRPTVPKPENSCRDALLSDLQQRLPEEVDALPEGQYANDKRADMRVFHGGFQVPVEVKKDTHPKLWSALRDQLIELYVRDPDTDGYGLYLVLWFGDHGKPGRGRMPPPPTGTVPRSPGELKERLEAGLTRDEKRKIAVCVLDVSPGRRSTATPFTPR